MKKILILTPISFHYRGVFAMVMMLHSLLAFASPVKPASDIVFEKLTIEDGLSDLTVRSIIQDHVGYMWFGTNNGLNRYDGNEIVSYFFDRNDPNSLKGNIIYCLFEDSRNNLWVGTWGGGLSLYNRDLDNFTSFIHDPSEEGTIGHNDIWHIFEDSGGRLWIATQRGLERFDYESLTFEKHLTDLSLPGESVNLKRKAFSCISEKDDGTLWISIWKHGLLNYDQVNKKIIQHYIHEPGNRQSLSTSEINTLFTDHEGSLWIGTYKGDLEKLHFINGNPVFEKYPSGPSPYGISDDRINFIIEDRHHFLWIGTEAGINILNKLTGQTEQYFHNAEISKSLSSNHLWSGYVSRNGIIWIGSLEGGVNIFDPWRRKFASTSPAITEAKELPQKFVKSIFKDRDGFLWVGTDHGLNYFSPQNELLHTFVHGFTNKSLDIGGVSGIVEDQNGRMWIGTWGGGLHHLSREKKVINRYFHAGNKEAPRGISDLNIQTMVGDHEGNILIGTSFGYFYRFNPLTEKFQQLLCQDLDSLRGSPVSAISPDSDGTVWIGLIENGGLIHHNFETNISTRYYLKNHDQDKSLSSNDIFSLLNDGDKLWIGTKNGLNLLDKITGSVLVYDEKHGLANKSVLSIQKDIEGHIWFSTPHGISKFDRQTELINNYDGRDGALGNCIVSWKGLNSELYFGGINGIFSFNPLAIANNPFLPEVVFTSLSIFNKTVAPNEEDSPLKKHINQTTRITLNHNQTSFSFQFAALNYTLPEKNQYRYKLEGFDPDWVHAGTRNVAYYTNVHPGTFTFMVQGSNNDGFWNEEPKTIEVVILPPWWTTLWFKILVLIFAIVGIVLLIAIRTYRIKQKQIHLKKLVRERTREIENQQVKIREQAMKIHASDQMKIRFLTNISHEFRTPLTLILNPLEKLFSELSSNNEYKLPFSVIKRNALRLASLINQFLDITKIEAGELKLSVSRGDISSYIAEIVNAYKYATYQKNIHFNVQLPRINTTCYFDGDKIEKILYNLLSNALKFTPVGGRIDLVVEMKYKQNQSDTGIGDESADERFPDQVYIRVEDTGIGIPPEQTEKIFERFYQVEGQHGHHRGGTGIGLSLTKDLVRICGGTIEVRSRVNQGTRFILYLPVGKDHFSKDDIKCTPHAHDGLKSELIALEEDYLESETPASLQQNRSDIKDAKTLLIVEDNHDVRQYLFSIFNDKYNVLLANDGQDGLEKTMEFLPSIIISDVMMPHMNGYEFCEKVKSDMLTCHIPVIMLTAKATNAERLTGIELGADAYISKPFEIQILQATVAQLIDTREKIKLVLKRDQLFKPKNIEIQSSDEKLLEKIARVLNDNISEPDFGVEELGKEVGLSRTHLYRKIKELTSFTAIEFIRNMRLQLAGKLLRQNKLYVSEVAYMCGFKELSYFRKVFKEVYGMSPQEYANSTPEEALRISETPNQIKKRISLS
jgi:signal transduction histidine kinase/ligand-binding sensor domain-containing protein/AraC-like DNA-binding protein/AmiR/NasT family two-component response regulator